MQGLVRLAVTMRFYDFLISWSLSLSGERLFTKKRIRNGAEGSFFPNIRLAIYAIINRL